MFNFYAADHLGGCRVPPPVLPLPESSYSASGKFWYIQLRHWLTSWPVIFIIAATHGIIHLLSYPYYDRFGSSGETVSNGGVRQSRQAKELNDNDKEANLIAGSIIIAFVLAFALLLCGRYRLPSRVLNPSSCQIHPSVSILSSISRATHH